MTAAESSKNTEQTMDALSEMSDTDAANALVEMEPQVALSLLEKMDEKRAFLVEKKIFENHFRFSGQLVAWRCINNLNNPG